MHVNAESPSRAEVWAKRMPLLACLFVLVVGWIYSQHLGGQGRFKDERDYMRCGRHLFEDGIFSTNGEEPTAYRPPGYPVVLGTVLQIVPVEGSGVCLRMTNYFALCGTLLLGAWMLRRRGRPRAAIAASIATALYPPFLYTASTLYPQTVGALLLTCFVLAVPTTKHLGLGRAIGIGVLGAMLTLTIPTFLAGIALTLCWILWRGRGEALAGVLVAGLVLTAGVGSWTYRNYKAFDAFVPISTNAGRNLLLGNSPDTTPTSGVNVDLTYWEEQAAELEEPARDRLYRDAALEWIRDNPGSAAVLYVGKVLNHFNVWNTFATDDELGQLEALGLAIVFVPLFVLFLRRLWRAGREPYWANESLLVLIYFGMALATALFFTRIRFRLPLDHFMIWIAAASLMRSKDDAGASVATETPAA